MKINITKQIESGYADLRPSEKLAADYILDHLEQIPDLPIDRLAKKAGVSQPTVLRMLKALGYKGYKDSATSWSPNLQNPAIRRRMTDRRS